MKKCISLIVFGVALVGCHDSSQDIPPGASFKDPTGMAATNQANGPTEEEKKLSQKMGDNAKNFGEQMNAKYGNR
jgi:hypothetical protein